jgi:hypothetical protein
MVKMKLSEAIDLFRGLAEFANLPDRVPVKLSYACGVNRRKLMPVAEGYDEAMKAVLERNVLRDPDGNMVTAGMPGNFRVDPDKMQDYANDARAVGEELVDVDLHMVDFEIVPESFPAGITMKLLPMLREPAPEFVPEGQIDNRPPLHQVNGR